ncbi:MAG: Na/Pi symporter [Candidatus Marinimicrobia bacterium]|nr:Na/Pi symporter [Candidatus Neomarinimicrobiota bacterium]
MNPELRQKIIKIIIVIITIYLFLLSIKLLGHSFKLFGKEFAEAMLQTTSNPFAGLLIGIVATSLIQSSSTTTAIVVGLVAGGVVNLENAIPIIMGANIGTTVTNTLVSLGHVGRKAEFKRAFAAGIVHDYYNISAVIVLFPIEIKYHIIQKVAIFLNVRFEGVGGMKMFNPLKAILNPVIHFIDGLIVSMPFKEIILLIISIIGMFAALAFLIKMIRSLVVNKIELIINKYLFKNDALGMFWGMMMTFIVQSSSVTTSLIVPLAGAGIVKLKKIFPYTLGANIGTTGTALLAALATGHPVAVTAAFAHLTFNIFGIMIFYPLRFIPIILAEKTSVFVSGSRNKLILFISIYIVLHFIPILFMVF